MHSLIDYVAFVPNALTDEMCDTVIKWYNDNKKLEYRSSVGDFEDEEKERESDHRTSKSMAVPLETEVDNILSSAVNKTLLAYFETMNTQYILKDGETWDKYLPSELQSETFQINRYSDGQEYKWHFDQGFNYLNKDGTFTRIFSIVIYLNDDFEGGETEFQFTKIKPQKGACLIFPSHFMYNHCARPVTNGTKYACASWLKPLIKEKEKEDV